MLLLLNANTNDTHIVCLSVCLSVRLQCLRELKNLFFFFQIHAKGIPKTGIINNKVHGIIMKLLRYLYMYDLKLNIAITFFDKT